MLGLDGIVFSIKKSADIDLNDSVTVIINNEIIENVCGYLIELNNYFKIEIIKNSNPKNDHGFNAKTTIIINNRKEE